MQKLVMHWLPGQNVRTLREALLRSAGEYPYHRGKMFNYVDEVLPRDWRRVASPVVCEIGTGDECHVWRFGMDRNGFGVIRVRGIEPALAARVSFLNTLPGATSLDFDPELAIVHTCPLPFCVRPEHLVAVPRAEAAEADCRILTSTKADWSEHPHLSVHRGEALTSVPDVPTGQRHECHYTLSVDPGSADTLRVCVACASIDVG